MAEFTAHIANLGKYNAGVLADTTLSFPATTEQVQAALGEIGIDRLFSSEIVILDYNIGIKGVARALGEYTHIDELCATVSRRKTSRSKKHHVPQGRHIQRNTRFSGTGSSMAALNCPASMSRSS